MKTVISRAKASISGRRGVRSHAKIVDNVFKTRDVLEASSANMLVEIESNNNQIRSLRSRNEVLRKKAGHAQTVAANIAHFFLPR